jgi:uncharacterized membrane protein YcjF (UPF0283 family)
MKTKKETEKENNNGSAWKDLTQTFVTTMLAKVSDNISTKLQNWFNEVKRRTLGALMVAVGLVFILVCLSLYINTFFSEGASWIGYGAVGILILVVGYVLSKK